MSSQNQQSWVLFTLQFLIFPTLFAKVSAFDRPECLARVTALLKDDNVSLNPAYFWQPNGVSMTDPVLTVAGCKALCRGGSRWYIDIGPRLMTWLLPIVLLIGNLDVSPLDKWRYIEVFHLIGDPMDSSWSFLAKTEAWASCHRLIAQHYPMNSGLGVLLGRKPTLPISTEDIERSPSISSTIDITILSSGLSINELATVVAGIKEVLGPSFNPLHQLLMHVRPGLQPQTKEYNAQIQTLRGAAFKIAERRTDDILRTVFAVVIYLLQILAGFTKVLGGGNSSPPGGRIGTAMLLTWLLPTVIFSNFVGGFASRRDCFEIIKTMIQELDKQSRQPPDSALQQRLQDKKKFTENQRWSGGSYIYRPQKYVSFGAPSRRRKILIWLLSIAPVLIALVSGSVIMW